MSISSRWVVSTPHDIEAERVAQAFGGFLSCVSLVDRVVPAIRARSQLLARRRLADIVRAPSGGWMVAGCGCRCGSFRTLEAAARHEREDQHWAFLAQDLPVPMFTQVARAVDSAHPGAWWGLLRRHLAWSLVREPHGLAELWRAGVAPEYIVEVHGALGFDEPLPMRLYLATAYLRPCYDWLRAVLDVCGDPDIATWCAWTESELDRRDFETRLQWLGLGLPRHEVRELVDAGYVRAEADEAARVLGCTPRRAAAILARWHRAGCRPDPSDLVAAWARGGNEHYVPTAQAVDALLHHAGRLRPRPTRTELGLALAAAGTAPLAFDYLLASRECN